MPDPLWSSFCWKLSEPRHCWVWFWRFGRLTNLWTHQGLYHLMGTAVRYGRLCTFYVSWTHFVFRRFSAFSFCLGLHSKAGWSSSWRCFNVGIWERHCLLTQARGHAMPETNVRNSQCATFQRRLCGKKTPQQIGYVTYGYIWYHRVMTKNSWSPILLGFLTSVAKMCDVCGSWPTSRWVVDDDPGWFVTSRIHALAAFPYSRLR